MGMCACELALNQLRSKGITQQFMLCSSVRWLLDRTNDGVMVVSTKNYDEYMLYELTRRFQPWQMLRNTAARISFTLKLLFVDDAISRVGHTVVLHIYSVRLTDCQVEAVDLITHSGASSQQPRPYIS